jgi:S1-C subfamily serine protease
VEGKSPAEAANLMVGDILVGIDGQPLPDHDALFACLTGETVDQSIPLELLRGGQPLKVPVKIGARQ